MSSAGRHSDHRPPRRRQDIAFIQAANGYWGEGAGQRSWHITKAVTGWRLEFRDPEDDRPTYAGIHSTLDRAKREAELVTGAG